MKEFIFVGYTLRERFNPNEYKEYKETLKVGICNNIYTLDTSISNYVQPYDIPKFDTHGEYTNTTMFSYNYEDMKKYVKGNEVILGCFIESEAINDIKIPFDSENVFEYARFLNKSINNVFKFLGYEVLSNIDFSSSANTNMEFSSIELNKYGDITDGSLFKEYLSAYKFKQYLNTNMTTAHEPFSIWQIWTDSSIN